MDMKRILQLSVSVLMAAVTWRWFFSTPYESDYIIDKLLNHIPLSKPFSELVDADQINRKPHVKQVVDGVYMANGYGMSNVFFIEGQDGLVAVDSSASLQGAMEIVRDLRAITNKPIKAIIYTHHHNDHLLGGQAFIENKENPPEVWAHERLTKNLAIYAGAGPRYLRGTVHQFGIALGKYRHFPFAPHGLSITSMLPITNIIYEDVVNVSIAGVEMTLLNMPGETDDHINVWLPDKRALFVGDNIYKLFPNVYAIRGTPARDIVRWMEVLRRMRALRPAHLLPSHTQPEHGDDNVASILTRVSNALQYINDQTVRMMNAQAHPEDISRRLKLPASLISHPYLQEYYGTVPWTARSVYNHYVGWFSGDAMDLEPLSPTERAERLVNAVTVPRLLNEAERSLSLVTESESTSDEAQWSLELASAVLRVDRDQSRARQLRLQALRALASHQTSICGRNYYMTAALDDHHLIPWTSDMSAFTEAVDMQDVMPLLKYKLNADLVENVNQTLYIRLNDLDRTFKLEIIYSVLNVEERSGPVTEITLETADVVWRQIMLGKLHPGTALNAGHISVHNGNLDTVRQFLSYFDF